MFHLAEYRRKPDRLSDRLPWAALVAPGIVLNKDGSLQRTVLFRGPDLDSSTRGELVAVAARLNNALKRLGSGWCLHVEARRRHAVAYPESAWPDPVTQLIDDERRDSFLQQGAHFETDYYATFTWLPPEERIGKAGRLFIENAGAETTTSGRQHLEFFVRQTGTLISLLEGFMRMVEPLGDGDTLTYLHGCVSFREHRVAVPEVPFYLDALLTDSPLLGGLQPRLGSQWLKIVSIRAFPSRTIPALLDGLNALPLEYRWVCRWLPFDKPLAAAELARLRRQWFAKRKSLFALLREAVMKEESPLEDPEATAKTADADAALGELGDDACAYGYFTLTISVWDEGLNAAGDKVRAVQQVLDGLGFVSEVETVNAVEAWLGSLPGHPYADIRRPIVSSLNLAHLVPMSAIWAGPEMNRHLGGPPLLFAQARGRTPFRLDLHVSDVGHTMIVGPTGAGKSTLMALICAQFRRYPGAQVYIFDKGASCRALTCAVGGDFYDLGATGALAFQPLSMVDHDDARAFAEAWLVDILRRENVPITPELKDEVWETLCNLATAPLEERTLTLFTALAQESQLKEALKSYTHAGPHGRLLDDSCDRLSYGSWQTFELESLMANRGALIPVLTYLFYRLEQRFTGRPTLLVLDEAWLYLTESFFAAQIRDWLKTLRKKNVAVVFATQSLADIAESDIASVLIESCPSRIFLPNDRALDPTTRVLYERFGLNEQQIAMLATAAPKRDYYYQSRRGNRLFELGLGQAGLTFCGSSRPEDQQLIATLRAKHGADAFAHAFLTAKGHPELAERLHAMPDIEEQGDRYVLAAE